MGVFHGASGVEACLMASAETNHRSHGFASVTFLGESAVAEPGD